jgi:hypothetical protein
MPACGGTVGGEWILVRLRLGFEGMRLTPLQLIEPAGGRSRGK